MSTLPTSTQVFSVRFRGKKDDLARTYDYLNGGLTSAVGKKVVVDTPWSGYVVVTILSIRPAHFPEDRYLKRIVDVVDDEIYLRATPGASHEGVSP